MTQFYEVTDRNAESCSFSGNATINTGAPGTLSAIDSAVSECLSNTAATFTPTAPSGDDGGSTGGGGGSGSGGTPRPSQSDNSAVGAGFLPIEGAVGAAVMMVMAAVAGALTIV